MKEIIRKIGIGAAIVLSIAFVLAITLGLSIYKYHDCKKVGHSTFYCVLNFGK